MSEPAEKPSKRSPRDGSGAPKKTSAKKDAVNSRAYVTRTVTLESHQAQQAYKRFKPVADSFYRLAVYLRIFASEQDIKQIDSLVEKAMADVAQDLAGEIARLQAVCEGQGLAVDVQFSRPLEESVTLYTPRSARYLTFIADLDKISRLMAALWMANIVDDAYCARQGYAWQRRVIKLGSFIRDLSTRAYQAAERARQEDPELAEEPEAAVDPDGGPEHEEEAVVALAAVGE